MPLPDQCFNGDQADVLLATGCGTATEAPEELGADETDGVSDARAGGLGELPPMLMPIPIKINAAINPPPHLMMALPRMVIASPSHIARKPIPAVAADAIVISTPAPIATNPSTSLRPRGRRTAPGVVILAWLLAGVGIDGGDASVTRKSLRQYLHKTAASWISSAQKGQRFILRSSPKRERLRKCLSN
jgi:hypothetical protein